MMKYILIGIIVPCTGLTTAGIAIRNYKFLTKAEYCLLAYLCFTTAANLSAKWLASQWINNMPLLHVDTLIETSLFVLFFRLLFLGERLGQFATIVLFLFPVACLINALFKGINSFNTYPRSIEAIVLIAFSSAYWLPAANRKGRVVPKLILVRTNWMVSGIQLYFTSTMFLFIYSNFLLARSEPRVNDLLWNLHGLITIAMYLLFAKGFSLCKS